MKPSISNKPSLSPLPSISPSLSPEPSSISNKPSLSPLPSISPSLSPLPSISPSLSPEPSPTPQTQNTYFQIVANSNDHKKLCVEAGDEILLQNCDKGNKMQLWRADAAGQLRSFQNEQSCLTWMRRKYDNVRNLVMGLCVEDNPRLPEIFILNGFQNTILYMKTRVDWQYYGFKAMSTSTLTAGSLVTLEWHRYGQPSSDFSQVWEIEYPNIKLPNNDIQEQ